MTTATRLSGFALGLVLVFGGAYGVGQLIDPIGPAVGTSHEEPAGRDENDHDQTGPEQDGHPDAGHR